MFYKNTVEPATLELLEQLSCSKELIRKGFALTEGTSLALQIGHRISVDLDFFTLEEFSLEDVLPAFSEKHEVTLSQNNALSLFISGIKVDFLRHHYPILNDLISKDDFLLYNVTDIAAMKLNAIVNRGAKKDFYLLEKYSPNELMSFYQRKYGLATDMLFIKSALFFEDAEDDPDPIVLDSSTNWEKVKIGVQEKFKSLL